MGRHNDKLLCHKVFIQIHYTMAVTSLIIVNNHAIQGNMNASLVQPFQKIPTKYSCL